MGANNGTEQGIVFISGSAVATGRTPAAAPFTPIKGYYNFTIWGVFVGTIELDRSFDGGTTWVPVSLDALGDKASYTQPISVTGFECENGVVYSVNVTAYTSGTINFRVSGPQYGANEGVQSIMA